MTPETRQVLALHAMERCCIDVQGICARLVLALEEENNTTQERFSYVNLAIEQVRKGVTLCNTTIQHAQEL